MKYDMETCSSYLYGERTSFSDDEIFITDLMRQRIGKDDSRIQ